jgi:malate permease and related proteins
VGQYWIVIAAVLPIFLVILSGGAIRRANWLSADADHSLMRVTVNLLIPALILDALLGNQALADTRNVVAAPIVGFCTITGGLLLAYFVAPWLGLRDKARRRTFAVATGIYNYGYIPIPLVLILFDRETLGVLFLHNLGVEIALWTVGVSLLRGTLKTSGRALLNPPILAVVTGLVVHYTGLYPYFPQFLLTLVHLLGSAAVPLALLLIGATMADNIAEFDPKRGASTVIGACFLRLGALAVLFLALAIILPVSSELKQVIILQAAMPVGVFPLILAKHYGGHVATALRVVFWTCFISLLTIPFWIRLGLHLIEE